MLPVRELLLSDRNVSEVRLPSWVGMLPVKLLPLRRRLARAVRLPS